MSKTSNPRVSSGTLHSHAGISKERRTPPWSTPRSSIPIPAISRVPNVPNHRHDGVLRHPPPHPRPRPNLHLEKRANFEALHSRHPSNPKHRAATFIRAMLRRVLHLLPRIELLRKLLPTRTPSNQPLQQTRLGPHCCIPDIQLAWSVSMDWSTASRS